MAIEFYVFCPLREDSIFANVNGTLIITIITIQSARFKISNL